MIIRVLFSMLMTLAGMSCAGSVSDAETLRFMPLPMENRETVIQQFRPMTDFLAARLDVDIVYHYCDSYADILDRFRRSQVDLVYLGPLPYVELRAACSEAEPLVRFKEKGGQATYTCALVTFPDAVFDPQFADNRKIALTQPLSTCGYLSSAGLMRYLGSDIERNRYRYLGRHDDVALSVIRGEFDAGGLKTAIARKFSHMGLDILAETRPLPGFALVGNTRTLSPGQIARIRQELIALDPDGRDRDRLKGWGTNIRNGTVAASDTDYQVVRDLLGGARIPMEGNF